MKYLLKYNSIQLVQIPNIITQIRDTGQRSTDFINIG